MFNSPSHHVHHKLAAPLIAFQHSIKNTETSVQNNVPKNYNVSEEKKLQCVTVGFINIFLLHVSATVTNKSLSVQMWQFLWPWVSQQGIATPDTWKVFGTRPIQVASVNYPTLLLFAFFSEKRGVGAAPKTMCSIKQEIKKYCWFLQVPREGSAVNMQKFMS